MNNVSIMGRIARDPEVRSTQNGKNVASFTVAVQRDKDNTDWIQCRAWEKTADMVKTYFPKGSMIGATGSIRTESYEKDGQKRTNTYVLVSRVDFCGGKADTKPVESNDDYRRIDDGDLPF